MFRVEPKLPVESYKTYEIRVPRSSHWRPAGCAEVGCPAYLNGWKTVVDTSSELGQAQAHYIRTGSGRRYTEDHEGAAVAFTFEAGQECFAAGTHQARVDRPELYVVRGGDHRGNPRGELRQHRNADDWVEDFGAHQDRLKTLIERG
jgi:hypothetical protein